MATIPQLRPGRGFLARRGIAIVLGVLLAGAVLPVVTATVSAKPAGATGGCSSTPADGYGQAVCGDSPLGFYLPARMSAINVAASRSRSGKNAA